MDDATKIVSAGILGYFSALTVQGWKSSRDEFKSGIDELCKLIDQSSDVSAEYWLLAPTDNKSPVLEAKVLGLQERILGLHALVFRRLNEKQKHEAVNDILRLIAAFTGSNFSVGSRTPDPAKARVAHQAAARAIVSVRAAMISRNTVSGTVRAYLGI